MLLNPDAITWLRQIAKGHFWSTVRKERNQQKEGINILVIIKSSTNKRTNSLTFLLTLFLLGGGVNLTPPL